MTAVIPAQRRYQAAVELERARQIAREASKYGLLTQQHGDAVRAAEQEWDLSRIATWAVIER